MLSHVFVKLLFSLDRETHEHTHSLTHYHVCRVACLTIHYAPRVNRSENTNSQYWAVLDFTNEVRRVLHSNNAREAAGPDVVLRRVLFRYAPTI